MEKMIKKMMVAGLACIAMCGTAMAAPKHGNNPAPKGKAPMVQMAKPTQKSASHGHAAPKHQVAKAAPRHHEVRRPAHRLPPPRPKAI